MNKKDFHIKVNYVVWFTLSITCVLSLPTDEFMEIMGNPEDLTDIHDQPFSTVKYNIIPGFLGEKKIKDELSDFISETSEYYVLFKEHMKNGHTNKYLPFNIYDKDMREATVILFHVLKNAKMEFLAEFHDWLEKHVNKDMIDYAQRIRTLYSHPQNNFSHEAPFKQNPMYFINSETIAKANRLKMNCGMFDPTEGEVNQYNKTGDIISINSNYSGWNLMDNGIDDYINYFREDIGLNSFYYGIHLLHPHWKTDEELTVLNPRHAEHYFYCHHKLLARYKLEKEHNIQNSNIDHAKKVYVAYDSYLRYDNGLPFPQGYTYHPGAKRPEQCTYCLFIVSSLTSMTECISRGFIVTNEGIKINLTDENHTDVIMKLIHANFDNADTAKYVRSIYGSNGYPADTYNPAPSVIHHPQTSLREPVFWAMIARAVKYVWDYRKILEPLNLSLYENKGINIKEVNIPNITTYYEYYQFDLEKGLNENYIKDNCKHKYAYTARQRRLQHENFSINITVGSLVPRDVITRIFIGPHCDIHDCFQNKYTEFFEVDNFRTSFHEGENVINWSPRNSLRLLNDEEFNLENEDNMNLTPKFPYSIFKFPSRLVIPKGNEDGLKLKLFLIVTNVDSDEDQNNLSIREASIKIRHECYKSVSYEHDMKPLGFPFHRKAKSYTDNATNYRFYDIIIYHKKSPLDKTGYFSQNLY